QHPGLGGVDADVAENDLQLGADEVGRGLVDRAHLRGRLGGQRHDRAHPVTAEAGERLQIGLDPGSSSGIRAGDRDAAWNHAALRLASSFVATVAGTWDELLAGEELAYLTEVPAREPDVVPFPKELNLRVRSALEAQ